MHVPARNDRPRIAIDPELTAGDPPRVSLPLRYATAVERAGGAPLVLTPSGDEALEAVLDGVDGLLLSGGDDFDLARLGRGATHPAARPVPAEKQDFDFALVARALERGLPVLGICYGMQCLGLAAGARLLQHLPEDRPAAGPHGGGVRHDVQVRAGTKLRLVLGVATLAVVSRHHQALDAVEEPWIVAGTSPDGLTEAIELPGRSFALGVQWHPELAGPDAPDARLFEALVAAAREHAEARTLATGGHA